MDLLPLEIISMIAPELEQLNFSDEPFSHYTKEAKDNAGD
jgi:hypothetical protein